MFNVHSVQYTQFKNTPTQCSCKTQYILILFPIHHCHSWTWTRRAKVAYLTIKDRQYWKVTKVGRTCAKSHWYMSNKLCWIILTFASIMLLDEWEIRVYRLALHYFEVIFQHIYRYVRFLMSVTKKSTIFWNVTPCSSVKYHVRFGGIYYLHLQGKRQARQPARSKQTTRHYIPTDNTFPVRSCIPDTAYGPASFIYLHASTYSQLALHTVVHRWPTHSTNAMLNYWFFLRSKSPHAICM
jgi:hypothetical protein